MFQSLEKLDSVLLVVDFAIRKMDLVGAFEKIASQIFPFDSCCFVHLKQLLAYTITFCDHTKNVKEFFPEYHHVNRPLHKSENKHERNWIG